MEKIIVYKEPLCPMTEAYRILSLNLLVGLKNKKVIEVTSASSHNNCSQILANMAVAVAQTGKNVLLMDCNFRKPLQHEFFELQNEGVADILRSRQNFRDFVQMTPQSNLQVLAAGVTEDIPANIFQSPTFMQIIENVREEYDIIFLDVFAANEVTDALLLGTKADGCILIVTNKLDRVEQIQRVKERFTQAGITILGCVLDKV